MTAKKAAAAPSPRKPKDEPTGKAAAEKDGKPQVGWDEATAAGHVETVEQAAAKAGN